MPFATHVWTSSDNVIWNQDAKYFYYAHGPLARVEYGNDKVQGIDYAYTLQGWIKGVNSNTLTSARDIGKDGDGDTLNVNGSFAKDAFGYTLGYFAGDYKAASMLKWNTVANRFEAQTASAQFMADQHDLYNGNIAHMQTTIIALDTTAGGIANGQTAKPQAMAYQYDQLNRIKHGIAFNNIDIPNNLWQSSGQATAHMYENAFTYDANGNILNQKRYNDAGTLFDNMTYQYKKEAGEETQNRLYHVNDSITTTVMTDDIDDEGTFTSTPATINTTNNYRYDEIGNLKHDSQEQIDTIKWTVYGKIKEIKRTSGSSKHNLKFNYDASGNRIAKHEYTSAGSWLASTYYTRDAQGNTMATYRQTDTGASLHFKLQEQDIYGSSRAGMKTPNIEMIGAIVDTVHIYDTLGQKTFEGANHLGNVLTTFSDRKIPVDTNSDLIADYKLADVLSGSDYSPFGAPLANRGFTFTTYKYGFNGMEKDNEVTGNGNIYTTEFRFLDPRLGRWLSIDPQIKSYESPFTGFSNNPLYYNDPKGDTPGEGDDKGKKDDDKKTTGTDAGHGDVPTGHKWMDSGAISDDKKQYEKDYALKVEQSVNDWLSKFGVTNTRTRTGDVNPAGKKIMWRVEKLNKAGVDVMVSIHLNNGGDNNIMVYYEPGTQNEDNSKKLGESIITEVSNLSGITTDPTVKSSTLTGVGSLGILKYFKGEAGVLIEVGGIKSDATREYINTHSDDIGKQIAIAMYKYMYGKEPVIPQPPAPADQVQSGLIMKDTIAPVQPDATKVVVPPVILPQ